MAENDVQEGPKGATIQDLLNGATPEQRKWVIARITASSDLAAAKLVGVHRHTAARWPNKDKLDQAVALLLSEPQTAALTIIQDAVTEAARLKVAGLKSRKEPVAQAVATEILDRVLGRPTQRNEVMGAGGGPIPMTIQIVRDDGSDALPESALPQ